MCRKITKITHYTENIGIFSICIDVWYRINQYAILKPTYYKSPVHHSKTNLIHTTHNCFSVSGNKLTVTANAPVSNVTVAPTKQVPDLDSQVFFVWEHGTQQKLMSCKTEPVYTAMPAYFSVNVPPQTGNLSLTKTTEDGKNLSGWQFGIYSDSGCSSLVSGPHTTNSSGAITVTGLSAGTYYVKELGHTDTSTNALYPYFEFLTSKSANAWLV